MQMYTEKTNLQIQNVVKEIQNGLVWQTHIDQHNFARKVHF